MLNTNLAGRGEIALANLGVRHANLQFSSRWNHCQGSRCFMTKTNRRPRLRIGLVRSALGRKIKVKPIPLHIQATSHPYPADNNALLPRDQNSTTAPCAPQSSLLRRWPLIPTLLHSFRPLHDHHHQPRRPPSARQKHVSENQKTQSSHLASPTRSILTPLP